MYRKFNGKNRGKSFGSKKPYSTAYEEKSKLHDSGIPTEDGVSTFSDQLISKVSRNATQPIQLKLNPTENATKAAQPYALLAAANPTTDIKYEGTDNLSGNTVVQLQNGRLAKLQKIYDVIKAHFNVHYNFYTFGAKSVDTIEDYAGQAFEDAFATIRSNIMYELPYFDENREISIGTNLTMGGSYMGDGDQKNRLQELVLYQTLLQNLATVPNSYNMLMAMEDHLMNMESDGNAPILATMFGQFKRAAVRSAVQSVADILPSLYFDTKWYGQWASLAFVPSRRSNSMRDPLIVSTVKNILPKVKIHEPHGDDYSTDTFNTNISGWSTSLQGMIRPGAIKVSGNDKFIDFAALCEVASNIVSPYTLLKYVRSGGVNFRTYVNDYVTVLEAITVRANSIGYYFQNLTTMLTVATRSGLCEWKQGIKFELTKDNSYNPKNNKFLTDVIKCALLRPGNGIQWDETTATWHYQTIWDEYLGISAFDKTNGGNIIPFSMYNVSQPNLPGVYTRPKFLSVFTTPNDTSFTIMNRLGQEADFVSAQVDQDNASTIGRLFPMSETYSLSIPCIMLPDTSDKMALCESLRVMTRLFKIGAIAANGQYRVEVSSDLVCAIDVQVADFTKEAIQYGRVS